MKLTQKKSLYYDSVNLLAHYQNNLNHRRSVFIGNNRFYVAPMPSVVGEKFVATAPESLNVCFHRFNDIDYQVKLINLTRNPERAIASIGINDSFKNIDKLLSAGFEHICIDVANGYLSTVIDYASSVAKEYPDLKELIVGNIHTAEIIPHYASVMDNTNLLSFRVGIGGGSVCTTAKKATGYGRGSITEITEIKEFIENRKYKNVRIIADGGIRHSADAAKAFGAGADAIMMGSYFAKTTGAENVVEGIFKHWGCASDFNKEKFGNTRKHCEGAVSDIDKFEIISIEDAVQNLKEGICSAVSYSGYGSLEEYIGNATFEIL